MFATTGSAPREKGGRSDGLFVDHTHSIVLHLRLENELKGVKTWHTGKRP